MNWQGIPFKFFSEETTNTVNFALQSMPKIVIDTPTDYAPSILTGVVSLVAGIIPAGIAIWTFKRNAHNTKVEREAQERFLINERAAHIASTEKDRETQLVIAKQNFDMQVLSVNRQAWIDEFRDLISKYITIAPSLLDMKFSYNMAKFSCEKLASERDYYIKINDMVKYKELHTEYSNDLHDKIKSLEESKSNVELLMTKIKLMLNPDEIEYNKILYSFATIGASFNGYKTIEVDEFKAALVTITDEIESILANSQKLLKTEWVRVKKGI